MNILSKEISFKYASKPLISFNKNNLRKLKKKQIVGEGDRVALHSYKIRGGWRGTEVQ